MGDENMKKSALRMFYIINGRQKCVQPIERLWMLAQVLLELC